MFYPNYLEMTLNTLIKPFNDLKQLKKLQPKKLNKNSKSTRNKISF